jgi:hypothetical protein
MGALEALMERILGRSELEYEMRRASMAAAVLALAGRALAGGSPENVLIIVNPGSAESMYVADYYKNARNIPDANVLYLEPTAVAGPAPPRTPRPRGSTGTSTASSGT